MAGAWIPNRAESLDESAGKDGRSEDPTVPLDRLYPAWYHPFVGLFPMLW